MNISRVHDFVKNRSDVCKFCNVELVYSMTNWTNSWMVKYCNKCNGGYHFVFWGMGAPSDEEVIKWEELTMTNKHKTIEQCLDEAAREFDYKSYDDFNVLTTQLSYGAVKVYDKFIKRAMQIYTDSCVSAKLEEVREKLPSIEQINQSANEAMVNYHADEAFHYGFKTGALWMKENKVKELLK